MSQVKNRISKNLEEFRSCIKDFSDPVKGFTFFPEEVTDIFTIEELVALKHGLKPAISTRFRYNPQEYVKIRGFFQDSGFLVRHTNKKYIINSNLNICEPIPLDDERSGDVILVVSGSEKTLNRAIRSYAKDAVVFGEAMGYPKCCLEFGRQLSGNIHDKQRLKDDLVWSRAHIRSYRNSDRFSYLLNVFSFSPVISHVPCHLNCRPSRDYAKEVLNIIEKEHPKYVELKTYFLKLASLFWNYTDFILFEGKKHGDSLTYSESRPFLNSWKVFSDAPDTEFSKKLERIYERIKEGNGIRMQDDSITVLKNGEEIARFPKSYPYECILVKPDLF
jgi:hypothetical protein